MLCDDGEGEPRMGTAGRLPADGTIFTFAVYAGVLAPFSWRGRDLSEH
jgi:hypothetical protein